MPKELVIIKNNQPLTTSKDVSNKFEKRHDSVLRDIANIKDKVSPDFYLHNFVEVTYKDKGGRTYPMYNITKDGFTMLVMGYSGHEAMAFKEWYITKFNEMERIITSQRLAKMEFPALADNINLIHDDPKSYHYSNECDMINRIVLGLSAKQFREQNNVDKKESIRKYLSAEQINMIEKLQHVDVGMIIAIPDFYERQKALRSYYNQIRKNNLVSIK